MLRVPALGQIGEVCWVSIRNLKEDPSRAQGEGKPRPGILVGERGGRWLVIGTTSQPVYGDGKARLRIPQTWWEGAFPALHRPGFLWGDRVQHVPAADIGDHIGWAPPELRAFAVQPVTNLSPRERNDFLRLRPDEAKSRVGDSGPSATS